MSDAIQPSPHDALFRHAFEQLANAEGLLRALLPAELVAVVDWSTLALREGSHVDAALGGLESDLVFSARAGERAVLFYVLVEHQSSSDPMMVSRLWRYVTAVWEAWMRDHPSSKRLPPVIPIVVYHGARRWSAARCISELIEDVPLGSERDELVPRFTYILDDLTALSPEELRARALPAFASLVLWALHNAPRRSFAKTVGLFRDLFDALLASPGGAEALGAILRYLSIVTGTDEKHVIDDVLARLSEHVQERAMSLYDRFIQEGEAKGLAKGKAEGKAEGLLEGRRAILLKLLALKFGSVTATARARIETATLEELDRMAERVLTAANIDEVVS